MESTTKYENDRNAPPLPIGLSNNALKLEILDGDFCIQNLSSSSSSSKSYLQEFHDLDQFPLNSSSFNPDIGFQTNGFDPFDPIFHDSCSDFVLYKIDPFGQEINGSSGSSTIAAMQNLKNGGFLNFQSKKEVLMDIETSLNIVDCHDPKPLSFVFPDDQSSCVTTADHNIGCHKKDVMKRSKNIKTQNSNSNESESASTKKSGRGRKKSKSSKGQWTIEEDKLLIHLVEKFGVRKWSQIAQMLKGRIGKQCRERWHNHLRPDIKKDIWTEEEDRILIEAHAEVGNKWAEITKKLPGRTENSIKNHWNATKRRQFSRRKCRTKWPRPSSLLQNYIKSLNFEKGSSNRSRNGAPPLSAPTRDHDETLNASSVKEPIQPLEIEFCPADQMVPDFEFDEVPVFSFDDDDDLFEGGSIESFIANIPIDRPPEIHNNQLCFKEIHDNQLCFNEESPFDLQGEVKKEVDFFYGKDIELMDMIP